MQKGKGSEGGLWVSWGGGASGVERAECLEGGMLDLVLCNEYTSCDPFSLTNPHPSHSLSPYLSLALNCVQNLRRVGVNILPR